MPTMNVGIVAKSHLREAMPHLTEIESWLEARGVQPVFETATAALMPPNPKRRLADKGELVTHGPCPNSAEVFRPADTSRDRWKTAFLRGSGLGARG